MQPLTPRNIAIYGGAGRLGFPLALMFAAYGGHHVRIVDPNTKRTASIQTGRLPFRESGAQALWNKLIGSNRLQATQNLSDPDTIACTDYIVVAVEMPGETANIVARIREQFSPEIPIVLVNTLHVGEFDRIVAEGAEQIHLAYCPQRTAEGQAILELPEIPQIIAANCEPAYEAARDVFRNCVPRFIVLEPREAEAAKLLANTWRYIQFAAANHFGHVFDRLGIDYQRIKSHLSDAYPRAAGLADRGFVGGPCLIKDTRALLEASRGELALAEWAARENQFEPERFVHYLTQRYDLTDLRIGLLGAAYKPHSDDTRQAPSIQLKVLLEQEGAVVLWTDPYVRDPEIRPLPEVLEDAQIVVIGTRHQAYEGLRCQQPVFCPWQRREIAPETISI